MVKKRSPERVWEKADAGRIALLLLATVLLCANALDGEFVLDDDSKIVGNTDLRVDNWMEKLVYPYGDIQLLERNDPSRPVVFFVYTQLYRAFGPSPVAFHATSAFFHFVAAALVYLLTRRALFSLVGPHTRAFPTTVALLFMVTPIQMGTVIYAYGLSDVLSTALLLAALFVFVEHRTPGGKALSLSLLFFTLALFSKQSALVFPAILVAWDFLIPGEGPRPWRERLLLYLPFLIAVVLYLGWRHATFGALGDVEGRGNTHPALAYALSQPFVIGRYLFSSLLPVGLAIDHYVGPKHITLPLRALGFLGLFALAVFSGVLWRRMTPLARYTLFCIVLYFCALAPTSSFVPTVDLMVERRVYLANVGLFSIVALAFDFWGHWAFFQGPLRRSALGVACIHLTLLAGVSLVRNHRYSRNETLWLDVLSIYPNSERALNNLGNVYSGKKEYEKARRLFEQLLRLQPNDAYAHGNLGVLYEKEESPFHDVEKALRHFEAALSLNPDLFETLYNWSRLQQKLGNARRDPAFLNRALDGYLRVLLKNPSHVLAHNNLGLLYLQQNRLEEARREFETALKLDPNCAPALANLEMMNGRAPPVRSP